MTNLRQYIIEVQLVSLRAREDACRGYVANTDMQIETMILRKQIEALEELLRTPNQEKVGD